MLPTSIAPEFPALENTSISLFLRALKPTEILLLGFFLSALVACSFIEITSSACRNSKIEGFKLFDLNQLFAKLSSPTKTIVSSWLSSLEAR